MTARALLGLTPVRPGVTEGQVVFHIGSSTLNPYEACGHQPGRPLERAFKGIRGSAIGYVAQHARAALDPLQAVGRQVAISARLGGHPTDPLPWLRRAGFDNPASIVHRYPHQLSGGMAQRVTIAQALARGSRFLIADEPTTGLDPVISAALVQELEHLASDGIGVLIITHDLALLPQVAAELFVMDQGRIVETGSPDAVLSGDFDSLAGIKLVNASREIRSGRCR